MRGDLGSDKMPHRADVALDREMQAHIGRKLQGIYNEISREAVSDRFLELLDQLERREVHQP